MLSVIYAECHLCLVSFMLRVIYAECYYAECHLCCVVLRSVIVLCVVAPGSQHALTIVKI
jgi:hypothetical protein